MADTQTQAPQLEVWQNTGKGLVILKKLAIDGSTRDEPIKGGGEIRVTADERRTHTALCASKKLDPYRNGLMEPKNDAARAGQAEQAANGDGRSPWSSLGGTAPTPAEATPATYQTTNVIEVVSDPAAAARIAELEAALAAATAALAGGQPPVVAAEPGYQVEEQIVPPAPRNPTYGTPAAEAAPAAPPADPGPQGFDRDVILTGNGNAAKAQLARIDSDIVVEQLLAAAKGGASTPARIKLIEKRMGELNPHYTAVRSSRTVATGEVSEPGPQGIDMDGLDEPQDPGNLGIDGHQGDIAGQGPVPGFVPGEGVEVDEDGEPVPAGVDPRVALVPGGVPDGQPLPQMPPAGEFPDYIDPD